MKQRYFVTAISTDSGKTIVSAILCQALKADYIKPIQAGDLENSDSKTVAKLTSQIRVYPEVFRLKNPVSPHAAFAAENINVILPLPIPENENILVIEGAGGMLAPITHDYFMTDLARDTGAEIILVINFYLGSINHTLLSLDKLKASGLPVAGIIYNGDIVTSSKEVIDIHIKRHGFRVLGHVARLKSLTLANIVSAGKGISLVPPP